MSSHYLTDCSETDIIAEILNQKYNRFDIKERVITADTNPELIKILKDLSIFCLYELQLRTKLYKAYLIILKCPKMADDYKTFLPETSIGIYGSFLEVQHTSQKFIYIKVNDKPVNTFLILNPSLYLRVTAITETLQLCYRRNSLNQKYFSKGRVIEKYGIIGSMRHCIFQGIMMDENKQFCPIKQIEKEIIAESGFFLVLAEAEITEYKSLLSKTVESSYQFRRKYLEEKTRIFNSEGESLEILKFISTEYTLNSYIFSVKGKIDLLLRVNYYPKKDNNQKKEMVIPFELKTGKNKKHEYEHQVMLYNVCYNEGYTDSFSLIYYTETNEFVWVKNNFEVLASIMKYRNDITLQSKLSPLPKPIENEYSCNNFCGQNVNCAFNVCMEKTTANSHWTPDIEDIRRDKTPIVKEIKFQFDHQMITQSSLQYARQMEAIIAHEEESFSNDRINSLRMTMCFLFSNFSIHYVHYQRKLEPIKLLNFELYFKEEDRLFVSEFLQTLIINNELILVNKKNPDLKIEGKIKNMVYVNSTKISIFKLTIKVKSNNILSKIFSLIENESNFIDKYTHDWNVSSYDRNEFIRMRSNLLTFLTNVANKNLVNFVTYANKMVNKTSRLSLFDNNQIIESSSVDLRQICDLNQEQSRALLGCINTEDFALVQGFSGTGKTVLLSALVQVLMSQKHRILYCANSSKTLVSSLLSFEKVISEEMQKKVLRLVPNSETPDCEIFESYDLVAVDSIEDYKKYVDRNLFCTTITALDKYRLKEQDFDYVLIDESHLILEPIALKLISLGKKFIMFGDYFLLSTNSTQTSLSNYNSGFEISLFEKFSRVFLDKTFLLTLEYRSNAHIVQLWNKLFYQNKCKPATKEIGDIKLCLSYNNYNSIKPWLRDILFPKNEKQVIFVDTSNINYESSLVFSSEITFKQRTLSENKQNDLVFDESQLSESWRDEYTVLEILKAIFESNVDKSKVSVVVSFNKQKECILSSIPNFTDVSILQKCNDLVSDIVILVLTIDSKHKQESLKDFDKLNFALTRAKQKLIIVGATRDLRANIQIYNLIRVMAQKDWIVNVNKTETQKYFEAILEKNN